MASEWCCTYWTSIVFNLCTLCIFSIPSPASLLCSPVPEGVQPPGTHVWTGPARRGRRGLFVRRPGGYIAITGRISRIAAPVCAERRLFAEPPTPGADRAGRVFSTPAACRRGIERCGSIDTPLAPPEDGRGRDRGCLSGLTVRPLTFRQRESVLGEIVRRRRLHAVSTLDLARSIAD